MLSQSHGQQSKAGLVIIAAGATYIAASHAISKIVNNKNRKNHYLATLRGGTLYIGKEFQKHKRQHNCVLVRAHGLYQEIKQK